MLLAQVPRDQSVNLLQIRRFMDAETRQLLNWHDAIAPTIQR